MNISRRSFLTKVAVGFGALPLFDSFAWAQATGKLGVESRAQAIARARVLKLLET